MSLFTSLTSASRALDAQRFGLDVAGQNIANVNTPGYSRRTLDLESIAPDGAGTAGRGVNVVGVRALRDRLLEVRLQQEVPAQQREVAVASALSVVEAAVGDPGSSIDKDLENFFDAMSRLAESPVSATVRQDVLLQAGALAEAFRNMADRFAASVRDADRQVRSAAEDINNIAEQIRALNRSIATSPSEATLHLRDDQTQLVRQLSELIDIQVLDRPEGGVDITIGNGRPLVIGDSSYSISITSTPPLGNADLSVNGTTITSEITGGKLGGLLQVRDVNLPDYQQRLDDLAYEVAHQINTIHSAGYDQTGAAAGDLFAFSTPPGPGNAGAAAALIVDPTVAADPRLVAAAGIANGGDNQAARDMAALRSTPVLNGGTTTLSDAWGQLVYRVGRDTKAATDASKSRAEIVRQVDALRDQVSGVSLDEEAMHLLKFQRAYEANARFFSVIDQTIQLLLQHLGG